MKKTYMVILFFFAIFICSSCENQTNRPETSSIIEPTAIVESPNQHLEESSIEEALTIPVIEEPSIEPTPIAEETPSRRRTIDPFDFEPQEVVDIFQGYENAIHSSHLPFTLSDVTIGDFEGRRLEYSFSLNYNDVVSTAPLIVSIYAPYEKQTDGTYFGYIQKSFELYLDETCEESVLKDAIICSILAVSPELNYEQAEKYLQELVQGYSGEGRSSVIDLSGYKIHISKEVPYDGYIRGYPLLHVVSYEDIFAGENKDSYQLLSDESTFDDLIYLNGKITRIIESDYSNILEVTGQEGTVGIFYSADIFTGCIEEGKNYDFYGVMAKPHDGYDACMKLDYLEDASTSQDNSMEIPSVSSNALVETIPITENQESSLEVDTDATEKVNKSYQLNFEGVSWYADIIDISVYSGGNCIVTISTDAKEDGQFYAAAIWGCASSYGVKSVCVFDPNGDLNATFEE